MTGMPMPPRAVTVGLGRSNAVVAIGMLVFLGLIVGTAGYGAVTAEQTSARVLSGIIGGAFAIPLVMLLVALPRFLSSRSIVLDATGLRIVHGARHVLMPWQHVRALGIGYELAPEERAKIPVSAAGMQDAAVDYLAGRAAEVLQVSGKRRLALEIYPVWSGDVDRFPLLKPYWKQLWPPAPGLPPLQWQFPLPPVVPIAQAVDRGVRTFRPDRWLGWFSRPWSGS